MKESPVIIGIIVGLLVGVVLMLLFGGWWWIAIGVLVVGGASLFVPRT